MWGESGEKLWGLVIERMKKMLAIYKRKCLVLVAELVKFLRSSIHSVFSEITCMDLHFFGLGKHMLPLYTSWIDVWLEISQNPAFLWNEITDAYFSCLRRLQYNRRLSTSFSANSNIHILLTVSGTCWSWF